MLVGIVGTGLISNMHAKAIKATGCDIIFSVNDNIDEAKIFNAKYNIPYSFRDIDNAISKFEVSVLHICTPPYIHYEYAKKALENNIHVIVEKPLCLDTNEAKELMELAQKKNLICAVNYNVRFYDQILEMRKLINYKNFGEPVLLRCHYLQEFHVLPAYFSWRYNEKKGGKMRAVTEIGSHILDLIRFVTNVEISQVSANFGKLNQRRYLEGNLMHENKVDNSTEIAINSEDVCFINFKLANGAIGNIFLSEISIGHTNEIEIEVTSRKNSVLWNTDKPYALSYCSKDNGNRVLNSDFGVGFEETFNRFVADIYNKIEFRHNEYDFATFTDGYINVKICERLYESNNANGKWLEV
ncbi:MAG: Gfo/Idh/MocA family protein [Lachnospirales bacterium]